MSAQCLDCNSYAINPSKQSRDSDLTLCDVCHWRKKHASAADSIEALEAALIQIRDQHIGDCPAALTHLSDEEWARRCHGHLRSIARKALKDGE
jgi:hypothetical protein